MQKKLKKKIDRFLAVFDLPAVRIGIFFSFFFLILMIAILSVEQATNNKLLTLFDAFWFTIVTITTIGYGDVTPITVPGKLITVIILTSGIIVFGAVSGQVASVLFNRQQKKDKGLQKLKNKRGHFIICGWKPDMDEMLREILEANPELLPQDIVLVNTADEETVYPILSNSDFRGINFVNGDFSEEDTLLRANLREAEKILVLSDYSKPYSSMEMDSRNVLAVLNIKKLNRTIYVAAELIDDKFRKHLENEHCDEIILSKTYERRLIVSASSGTGVSHVMDNILGGSEGKGLVIVDIPNELINKSFGELGDYFLNREKGLPIGLLENTGNFYLRKQESLSEAQKNPDISAVVSNLKKVKELKSNRTVLAPERNYTVKKHSRVILIRPTGKSGGETV